MAPSPAVSSTVELAQQLIARQSVSPVDGGCQSLMIERLIALGFAVENLRFGPVDNFWAKRGKGGRLARRSPEDLQHVVGLIVGKLGERKAGMRSEELQKALKLDKKEITGPLNLALSTKKVVKTGQKRSTTYFAK